MLDTKTFKNLQGSIIHPNRNADMIFFLRISKEIPGLCIQIKHIGNMVEFLLGNFISIIDCHCILLVFYMICTAWFFRNENIMPVKHFSTISF